VPASSSVLTPEENFRRARPISRGSRGVFPPSHQRHLVHLDRSRRGSGCRAFLSRGLMGSRTSNLRGVGLGKPQGSYGSATMLAQQVMALQTELQRPNPL
jgi:hypothetical protein